MKTRESLLLPSVGYFKVGRQRVEEHLLMDVHVRDGVDDAGVDDASVLSGCCMRIQVLMRHVHVRMCVLV